MSDTYHDQTLKDVEGAALTIEHALDARIRRLRNLSKSGRHKIDELGDAYYSRPQIDDMLKFAKSQVRLVLHEIRTMSGESVSAPNLPGLLNDEKLARQYLEQSHAKFWERAAKEKLSPVQAILALCGRHDEVQDGMKEPE